MEEKFCQSGKNQKAISDRGWNPLNRALLLHPELRVTMTKKEESADFVLQNNIVLPNINKNSSSSNSSVTDTITEHVSVSTPTVNSIDLNFNNSVSSFCLKSIISQDLIHETREKINEDMNTGKSLKEVLKESKRISSGIVFKAGSVRLGKTVFDIHQENEKQKKKEMIEKIKKDEKEYLENIANAKIVFEKKKDLKSMTIKELTIVCKPLKKKEDGKMPTKKKELIQKYKEWDGRPPPSFDVSKLVSDSNKANNLNVDDVGNDNENADMNITEI